MRVLYRSFTPSIIPTKQDSAGMSAKISIIDALPHHVSALKYNLRDEDNSEILRLGESIQHALWYSYKNSVYRKTVMIDNAPVAMFGCLGVLLGGKAQPWLLTSSEVKKVSPLKFCRIYQEEVENMLVMFPVLENLVDAQYVAAIRLLEIVGFSVGESEPLGYDGSMFRKFRIERY